MALKLRMLKPVSTRTCQSTPSTAKMICGSLKSGTYMKAPWKRPDQGALWTTGWKPVRWLMLPPRTLALMSQLVWLRLRPSETPCEAMVRGLLESTPALQDIWPSVTRSPLLAGMARPYPGRRRRVNAGLAKRDGLCANDGVTSRKRKPKRNVAARDRLLARQ